LDTATRREQVEKLLKGSEEPITGARLAEIFRVSRQIIVGDISILRARGIDIVATPQGYFVPKAIKKEEFTDIIVSSHDGIDELEDELMTIVDNGGRILDVIVDHSLYGEIRSGINVSSRREAAMFVEKLRCSNSKPISSLTDGVHLHTVQTKNKAVFDEIVKQLKIKGYLIE